MSNRGWQRIAGEIEKINHKIDWVNLIVGAVIGVLITLPLQAAITNIWANWHKNETALSEAEKERRLMTDQGFESARADYQYVIDHAGLKHHLKVLAYQGMSRTYSEWTIARVTRGLSKKQYPELAAKYATLAEKEAPSDLQTGVAIAFADLASELGSPQHVLTEQKARELLANHPGNIELLYLAQETSFFEHANPSTVNNFMALLSLWTYFARKAQNTTDPVERGRYISRAADFLDAADQINKDHEIVLYRKGYLAQGLRNEWNKAAEYYDRALQKQPEFPQVNLNLAAIYASWGQYSRAQEQFREVIRDEDVPIESRTMALHDLGEVDLELKDISSACDAWEKATAMENELPMERLLSAVHTAMCRYQQQNFSDAGNKYRNALRVAGQQGLCLSDMTAYIERWKVGPEELKLAQRLNRLVKQSSCTPNPKPAPVVVSAASHS